MLLGKSEMACPVVDMEFAKGGAIIGDFGTHVMGVDQGIKLDRLAMAAQAGGSSINGHDLSPSYRCGGRSYHGPAASATPGASYYIIAGMKFGRIKRKHGRVEGLDAILNTIIKECPHVARIVPGRITVRRGHSSATLTVQYPTPAGLKCLYRATGTVQEVFLICVLCTPKSTLPATRKPVASPNENRGCQAFTQGKDIPPTCPFLSCQAFREGQGIPTVCPLLRPPAP